VLLTLQSGFHSIGGAVHELCAKLNSFDISIYAGLKRDHSGVFIGWADAQGGVDRVFSAINLGGEAAKDLAE
jgi:hypothetical protein